MRDTEATELSVIPERPLWRVLRGCMADPPSFCSAFCQLLQQNRKSEHQSHDKSGSDPLLTAVSDRQACIVISWNTSRNLHLFLFIFQKLYSENKTAILGQSKAETFPVSGEAMTRLRGQDAALAVLPVCTSNWSYSCLVYPHLE